MFKSNQEIIDWADQLVAEFLKMHQGVWAASFKEALASQTHEDLLGKLRFEFFKLEASDLPDEMGITDKVIKAVEMLNKAVEK